MIDKIQSGPAASCNDETAKNNIGVETGENRQVMNDLIEKLKAENKALRSNIEELRESEQKFHILTELAPVGIFSTDNEGNTTYVNPHWCKISGISGDEAFGDGWFKAVHPDDRTGLVAGWAKAVSEKSRSYAEYRFLHKDGKISWVIGNSVPQFNAEGRVVGYIGTITDITERKLSGERIRTLSRVAEQNPASISITDAAGIITWVNERFTDLMQYTLDDVKGRTPRIFNRGHIPREEYEEMWGTLKAGNTWRGEARNRRKDGTFFKEKVIITPLLDEKGRLCNYILISEDVTERNRMLRDLIEAKEKAEEADRLKTSFLNNLSHEIRTPMNAITGFSALLAEPGISDERREEFANIIIDSSDQLLNILNDIINISAIETSQVQVNETKTDLNALLSKIYGQFKPKAREMNNGLSYSVSIGQGSFEIMTDRIKLDQILASLVSNALKFTVKGDVAFGYSVSGEIIEFFVSDTGIGIPAGMHQEIFKPFRQLDKPENGKFGGPGLGLSIAKAYVELLGGKISLESEPGAGSTFHFTIPYKKVNGKR